MKMTIIVKPIIALVVVYVLSLVSGCTAFQNIPHYDKVYCWTFPKDNTYYVKIIFRIDGTFEIQEHLSELSLMKSPLTQTGTWYQTGNSVYLTTDYQNKVSDHLISVGPSSVEGYVELQVFSLYDKQPESDMVFFIDNKMQYTDSVGKIAVPNHSCQDAANEVSLLVNDQNNPNDFFDVEIDSNMSYVVFINNCLMSVMNKVKFQVKKDCLIEKSTGHRYEMNNN